MHSYLLFVSIPEPLFLCFLMMLCHCDFSLTVLPIYQSYQSYQVGSLGLLFYLHAAPFILVCDSGFARVYLIVRSIVTLVYTRAGRYQRFCDASRAPGPSTGGDGVYFPFVIL